MTLLLLFSPTALIVKLVVDAVVALIGPGDSADLKAADAYLAANRRRMARLGR